MELLELNDIQGYVIRGYSDMLYSRFVLLEVKDPKAACGWLGQLWPELTNAEPTPFEAPRKDTRLNIAFTADGLVHLGLKRDNLKAFCAPFREGMVTPHRTRLMGDFDSSDPLLWRWGAPNNDKMHIVLLVFGKDENTCINYYEKLKSAYTANGLQETKYLDGKTLPENKEHFGFRDGISQPVIKGSGRVGSPDNTVNPGEFILGYKNNYNVYPDSPVIDHEQGEWNLLPPDTDGSGKKDIGRNGTYLVIRQLQQDVDAFWTYMNDNSKNDDGTLNTDESVKLASKMIGRWPNGAPVTLFPDKDPVLINDFNDFGYAKNDKDGLKCPFGSHIRRSNPRDNFEDNKRKESLLLSNRHRIIRRGRMYGETHVGSPTNKTPNGEVGIIFNCFNADINRQFEFIQFAWLNYPMNKQQYNDPDPVLGAKEKTEPGEQQNFTIQACPVNKTVKGLPRFITIKGGGYFFFPAVSVVRFLASLSA